MYEETGSEKMRIRSPRITIVALLAIVSISLYFRLHELGEHPFWINEADNTRLHYFDSARSMLAWGSSEVIGVGIHSLIYYFYNLVSPDGFLIESEIGYRLPSVIASTLTIPSARFVLITQPSPLNTKPI